MPHRPFRFIHASDFHLEMPLQGVAEVPDHLRERSSTPPTPRPRGSSTRCWPKRPSSWSSPATSSSRSRPGRAGRCSWPSSLPGWPSAASPSTGRAAKSIRPRRGRPRFPCPPTSISSPAAGRKRSSTSATACRWPACRQQPRRPAADSPAEFEPDPAGLFSIAVAHGTCETAALEARGIHYWALGGRHSGRTLIRPTLAHDPGSPQGRRPDEPGVHGCTLVQVDEHGQARTSLLPTDAASLARASGWWSTTATGREGLEGLLRERIRALAGERAPNMDLLDFVDDCRQRAACWASCGAGRWRGELLALAAERVRLRPAGGVERVAGGRAGRRAAGEWYEQETILGDFLRAVRQLRDEPGRAAELESYLAEPHLAGTLAAAAAVAERPARQRVLREAALLGADLLSDETPEAKAPPEPNREDHVAGNRRLRRVERPAGAAARRRAERGLRPERGRQDDAPAVHPLGALRLLAPSGGDTCRRCTAAGRAAGSKSPAPTAASRSTATTTRPTARRRQAAHAHRRRRHPPGRAHAQGPACRTSTRRSSTTCSPSACARSRNWARWATPRRPSCSTASRPGLDRVSLVEVMRELETSRNRILDRGGGPCQVVRTAGRAREAPPGDRGAPVARPPLRPAGRRAEPARPRGDPAGGRAEPAPSSSSGWSSWPSRSRERWQRRAALDDELAALGPQSPMPPDAVERLDALKARWQKCQQQVERLDAPARGASPRGGRAGGQRGPGPQAARIEALLEQEPWIDHGAGPGRPRSEKEIAELRAGLAAEHERLGCGRRPTDTQSLPPSRRGARPGCGRRADPADLPGATRKQARQATPAANERPRRWARQVDAALARPRRARPARGHRSGRQPGGPAPPPHPDRRAARQMARYETELEEQSRRLLDRQLLPVGVLAGLGAAFVLGLVLVVAGVFMPATMIGSLGWALALLGLAGSVAAVGGKVAAGALQRPATGGLPEATPPASVADQAGQGRARHPRRAASARRRAGRRPAGSGRAGLGGPGGLAAAGHAAVGGPAGGRRGRARAAQAEEALAGGAAPLARGAGRRPACRRTLRPRQIRQIARRCARDAADRAAVSASATEELGQRRRELDMLVGRVAQLVADCGVDSDRGRQPDRAASPAGRGLERQQAQLARREAIRRQLQQLRRHRARQEEVARPAAAPPPAAASASAASRTRRSSAAGSSRRPGPRCCGATATRWTARSSPPSATPARRRPFAGSSKARRPAAWRPAARRPPPALAAVEKQLRDRLEKRGQLAEQMKTLAEDRQLGQQAA